MKVLFLTEGGRSTGFGHLTRCIALSQAFKAIHNNSGIRFIINGDDTAGKFLRQNNVKYSNSLWWKGKYSFRNNDIIFIDSYQATLSFFKRVRKEAESSYIVALDDFERLCYPVDLVVNPSLLGKKGIHRADVSYLSGAEHVILRKEFWQAVPKIIKKNIKNVLVTFGGNDMRNLTPKILQFLNESYPRWQKYVIIGQAFTKEKSLYKYKTSRVKFFKYVNAKELKRVMGKADIAISAAGQTLYELARVGTPVVAVAVADNQLGNISGWQQKGYISYAGTWRQAQLLGNIKLSLEDLASDVMRLANSRAGQKIVTGEGCKNIVKYILKEYDKHD